MKKESHSSPKSVSRSITSPPPPSQQPPLPSNVYPHPTRFVIPSIPSRASLKTLGWSLLLSSLPDSHHHDHQLHLPPKPKTYVPPPSFGPLHRSQKLPPRIPDRFGPFSSPNLLLLRTEAVAYSKFHCLSFSIYPLCPSRLPQYREKSSYHHQRNPNRCDSRNIPKPQHVLHHQDSRHFPLVPNVRIDRTISGRCEPNPSSVVSVVRVVDSRTRSESRGVDRKNPPRHSDPQRLRRIRYGRHDRNRRTTQSNPNHRHTHNPQIPKPKQPSKRLGADWNDSIFSSFTNTTASEVLFFINMTLQKQLYLSAKK